MVEPGPEQDLLLLLLGAAGGIRHNYPCASPSPPLAPIPPRRSLRIRPATATAAAAASAADAVATAAAAAAAAADAAAADAAAADAAAAAAAAAAATAAAGYIVKRGEQTKN